MLYDSNALRYYPNMIISYKCKDTERLANGYRIRRFINIERVALRKLRQLQISERLGDFRRIFYPFRIEFHYHFTC